MEGLTELSVGQLLDRLIICHLKCWHALEIIDALKEESVDQLSEHDLKRLAKASQLAHTSNRARSILVDAIDRHLNAGMDRPQAFPDKKAYDDA